MGNSDDAAKKARISHDKQTKEASQKSLENLLLQDDALSGGGQWDSEIKALLDNYTLKSLFFSEDWVFILLDLLASEISDVEMKVARESFTDDGRNVITWLDDHPLNQLIENPNPNQDYSTWMYLHVIEATLMGNGIQWYAENLNELHIIPAEQVFLRTDPGTNKLDRYEIHFYQNGMQSQDQIVSFRPDEILHQRRPNPVSVLWGLSPFIPNSKSLLFNRYTQDYLNSFYLKQATSQIALKLEKQVNEEGALRLMRSFEHSYTGRRNQRRTMLLPKGVDLEVISQTMADQNIVEIVNQNQEKIINILRIPKHALSLAEAGSLGSEEHKTALKYMWTSAIKPQMRKISNVFTSFFRQKGLLAQDERFLFDCQHIELLREDSIRTAELAIKQLEFKTLNEVRRDLYDLPPLDNGDATPIPFNSREIIPGLDPQGEEEEVEEEVEEEQQDEQRSDDFYEKKDGEVLAEKLKANYADWFKKNNEVIDTTTRETSAVFEENLLKHLEKMAKKSVLAVKEVFKDKRPKKTAKKSATGSRSALRDLLEKEYEDLEGDYLAFYTDDLFPALAGGYGLNVQSLPESDQGAVIAEGSESKRRASLRSRGSDAYDFMTASLTDLVVEIAEEETANESSVAELAASVVAGFAAFGASRTRKITGHESFTALSLGKKAAVDDASKVIDDLVKVWINRGDDRVRGNPAGPYAGSPADHWKMQGEVVDAKGSRGQDTKFSNGLRYPRDVLSTKKAEIINCRCDLVMTTRAALRSLDQ